MQINCLSVKVIYNKNKNNTLVEQQFFRLHEIRSLERQDSYESFIVIDDD